MDATMNLDAGAIVAGKYRCERALGEGGMGRVVAATHVVLRHRVALKVLTLDASPSTTSRFLREAQLAFRLTSEHVAKIYDADALEGGVPYIAMELLDGVDLAKLSHDRGPLPVAEACSYIVQACAGLAEAHALGIVHRDVKLANLFLASTPKGPIVKVLDFGCAKAQRAAMASSHATSADVVIGTPRYMAPEQFLSSRDVDARADVWSLGVALYTLLAGCPPFHGESVLVLMDRITRAPAPPIPRTLPDGLLAVLDRCLRKRPEDRYATARELAIALAPFTRTRSRNVPRSYLAPPVAIASMAAGAALFLLTHRHAPPSPPAPTRAIAADTSPSTDVKLPCRELAASCGDAEDVDACMGARAPTLFATCKDAD